MSWLEWLSYMTIAMNIGGVGASVYGSRRAIRYVRDARNGWTEVGVYQERARWLSLVANGGGFVELTPAQMRTIVERGEFPHAPPPDATRH